MSAIGTGRRTTNYTRERTLRAACWFNDHDAPAPNCSCGLYAVANVVDALYRLCAMTSNIRRLVRGGCWPYRPSMGMVPVLAHVTLHQVMDHDDIATAPILWHDEADSLATNFPVLRAGSAEIQRMFVTAEPRGTATSAEAKRGALEDAVVLAERLTEQFGVPAVAGFPEYTAQDWDARPEWMRAEPWRSEYRVGGVLWRFARASAVRSTNSRHQHRLQAVAAG
ncbi:hypothetical protein QGN31_06560 [Mycobacterium sp. 2-64]|uniref:hypothetical protein n=1 Tax=Mycobacterium sp. 2-64 TaxID=3042319 RepID=UPI002DDC5DEB|nr:hypothetical protein [Mycobacterium sp. 2-64]WSE52724.1 hypothetical protein QGN31_06560 [Mycobacterium sp. 2-64]